MQRRRRPTAPRSPPAATLSTCATCPFRLAARAANRSFKGSDGFVIVVHRVDVVTLGHLHRVLGVGNLQGRSCPHPVAFLRQSKLIPRGLPAGGLYRDCLEWSAQSEIASVDVASHRQTLSPDILIGIVLLSPRLREPKRTAEPSENRKREREAGAEGLAGIMEGEKAVLTQHLLLDWRQQCPAAVDQSIVGVTIGILTAERQRSFDGVVKRAVGGPGLGIAEGLLQQQVLVGE